MQDDPEGVGIGLGGACHRTALLQEAPGQGRLHPAHRDLLGGSGGEQLLLGPQELRGGPELAAVELVAVPVTIAAPEAVETKVGELQDKSGDGII